MGRRARALVALAPVVVLAAAGCASAGRSADELTGRALDAIGLRARSLADDGTRLRGLGLPDPPPDLAARSSARARELAAPHLAGLDGPEAEQVRQRACAVHAAALTLLPAVRDPDRALELVLSGAAEQLAEQRLEQRARGLAEDLVRARSAGDAVGIVATEAVCL